MAYPKKVITQVVQKQTGGEFNTTYLGAEQRFITGLLNSHVNNLEEQSILGIDCITSEWTDERGVAYTVKQFYDGGTVVNNGYYILFIADYLNSSSSTSQSEPFSFDTYTDSLGNKKLTIALKSNLTGKENESGSYNTIYDEHGSPLYDELLLSVVPQVGVANTAAYDGDYIIMYMPSSSYDTSTNVIKTAITFVTNDTYDDGAGNIVNIKDAIMFDSNVIQTRLDDATETIEVINPVTEDMIDFDETGGTIEIDPGFSVVKESILAFRTDISDNSLNFNETSDIKIATKTTSVKYDKNLVKHTQEVITNHLR